MTTPVVTTVLGVAAAMCVVVVANLIVSSVTLHQIEHLRNTATSVRSNALGEAGAIVALDTWITVALDTLAIDHTPAEHSHEHAGPVRTARVLAMVNVALANVVATSTGAFAPYGDVPGGGSGHHDLRAAIAAAAHGVLSALYPGQAARLHAIYSNYTITVSDAAGRELGAAVAANVLRARANDGSRHADPLISTIARAEPGHWHNDPIAPAKRAVGALWAERVAPFVVPSAAAFRVPPPPSLQSIEYAMEYYEVRALGGNATSHGCIRDAWREFVGVFWAYDGTSGLCAPARLYMQIVQAIAASKAMSLHERARLYGLMGLAVGDAALTAWDSKYHWLRERPVTAVRDTAARDGNDATTVDADWVPLGAPDTNGRGPNFTPPFPAYPSGHAVFGAAVFQTVRNILGSDEIHVPFMSDEFDGRVRPRRPRIFSMLSELEEENGQSRMYLGIHWASDKTAGMTLGHKVADYVVAHAFTPRAQ